MRTIPAPPRTRSDIVVDELHGHRIEDPYRWLEDASSPETEAWVQAQNAHTRSLLDHVPDRQAIHDRLTELLAIGVVSPPVARENRYFYTRRDGDQNQAVLWLRDGAVGSERTLVDPNRLSEEGLVTLDWWYPSSDGMLLAYGLSSDGDEWSTLSVLDVATGDLHAERIERARHATVAWLPDNSGFYYTRYPHAGEAPEGEENYHVRVFFHALGTPASEDALVFGHDLATEDLPAVQIAPGGRWLVVTVFHGWERSSVYLRDLSVADAPVVPVVEGEDALFEVQLGNNDLFLRTNLEAPHYRVLRVDPRQPARNAWQEVISEDTDALLEAIVPAGTRLIASYLRNAMSSLAVFEVDGSRLWDIALPGHGSITGVTGEWDSLDAFYSFESFTTPPTIFRLSVTSGEGVLWASVEGGGINPEEYEVRQEWYTSRDGTRVSIFLVHRRALDLSRPQPALLTGYGGFNLPRTPLFNRSLHLWLERGGIFALPNLRGGSEYGEGWHRAGRLEHKQNVFDDFIAAAEYLISQGYTERSQLAIHGRSNGGLLVGAALIQRPDLFRAVVCGVPLLDMLRYHHFLIARLWIPEYGSAENPEQFPYLYDYSPYHRVRDGVCYPPTLLTTAESDSRVDPLHARKMAARLQAATSCDHPILLRVETHAGHGIGKPLAKVIEEETDFWSFLVWQVAATPRSQTR